MEYIKHALLITQWSLYSVKLVPPDVCAGLVREHCVSLTLLWERLLFHLSIELSLNSFIHIFLRQIMLFLHLLGVGSAWSIEKSTF